MQFCVYIFVNLTATTTSEAVLIYLNVSSPVKSECEVSHIRRASSGRVKDRSFLMTSYVTVRRRVSITANHVTCSRLTAAMTRTWASAATSLPAVGSSTGATSLCPFIDTTVLDHMGTTVRDYGGITVRGLGGTTARGLGSTTVRGLGDKTSQMLGGTTLQALVHVYCFYSY